MRSVLRIFRRGELYAAALIVFSLAAFSGVSFLGDEARLRAAFGRVDAGLVLSLIGLALVNYILRAARFQMFARHLGIWVPFHWMFVYYVAGFSMSATPGKLGELLRLWLIRQHHGFRIERSLPLQIADRVFDVVASVVLCIGAIGAFSGYWTLVLPAAVLVAAGVFLLMRPALLYRMIDGIYRLVGRKRRWFGRGRRLIRMTARLFIPRLFLPALLLAVVGWGAECLAFDLCMRSIAGIGGLGRATFIFTFSNLVGGLSLLPGGVGTTEVSMASLLVTLGTQFEDAVTVTAVIRAATLWFGIALGLVAFTAVARWNQRPEDAETPQELAIFDVEDGTSP